MATPTYQERAVTPAMNNYTGRYSSAPRMGGPSHEQIPYQQQQVRSMTPSGSRYNNNITSNNSAYNNDAAAAAANGGDGPHTPSSNGLIRLSLKKPMGIVFEPMYDPNQPSVQRGVRICDLPRTGAAALSRKLQVGDELLQINDTTVSRMTFDEIMDFIIEADPDSVNLLFRRPRKETLQARQGIQQKLNAAANKDNPTTIKWVDEEDKDKKKKTKKKKKKSKSRKTTSEEDETLQSKGSTIEESYAKSSKRRSKKSKRGPYESESFLDMLIDTICSDSNNVCRDTFRRDDYSDDESFGTEEDETYATYEESVDQDKRKAETKPKTNGKYEDDRTLETLDTRDRVPEVPQEPPQPVVPPLGLAPNPPPPVIEDPTTDEEGNPAPIKELEYDDRIDHGADVSVMESLGGPSLLIEKQRAAQQAAAIVPADILEKFGLDFVESGMTREQAIASDPLKFYTYVVKQLLQEHEPEKVRLLDKLLAKYKGREDHLVQKLAVRYNKDPAEEEEPQEQQQQQQQQQQQEFTDAVKKNKQSTNATKAVTAAKERLQQEPVKNDWPEKETKEPEIGDEASETGSDYSRDSVDGTSPAVIAQVSELLNYVYGKTSVPGQIDRVSTIMRAYEGREAVLLELLETKALIKANKEKENADTLPSFLRNSQMNSPLANSEDKESPNLPPVTPLATQPPGTQGGTVINDDISSMSGVSSPVPPEEPEKQGHEVEAHHIPLTKEPEPSPMKEVPKINSSVSAISRTSKPPATPDKRKKKGLFGGLFGKKKEGRSGIRSGRKLKGNKSIEGSI